jgi:single-strand DNA-binding protein
MNDTYLTISGNVVDEPKLRRTATNGVTVLSFRVASTSRRRDPDTGEWGDRDTLFVNVTCWRDFGINVGNSVFKGQPVVVHGRFYSRQYTTKDEVSRVSYEIDAESVGHDLSRGTSDFKKAVRERIVTSVEADAAGVPLDIPDSRFEDEVPRPELAAAR